MEERWLVSIAPKKSDSGIYLSKIELFILRLPYELQRGVQIAPKAPKQGSALLGYKANSGGPADFTGVFPAHDYALEILGSVPLPQIS